MSNFIVSIPRRPAARAMDWHGRLKVNRTLAELKAKRLAEAQRLAEENRRLESECEEVEAERWDGMS